MDYPDRLPLPLHFLGHSTVLLELDGLRVLTDPVLLPRVSVLRRVPSQVDPAHHAEVDLVVISHLHADHLHLPSLRLLGTGTPIVVPAGAGEFLRRGFESVVELAASHSHQHGPVRVTATHAEHDGFRPPFGPRAAAVGYLLETGDRRVYFAGDTDLFPGMAEIGAPGLDLALLPVWGWGLNLGPGHLDPARAARAAGMLGADNAVPIHWGTLSPYGIGRWMRRHLVDPPRVFAAAVDRAGLPTRVIVAEPGWPVGEL